MLDLEAVGEAGEGEGRLGIDGGGGGEEACTPSPDGVIVQTLEHVLHARHSAIWETSPAVGMPDDHYLQSGWCVGLQTMKYGRHASSEGVALNSTELT